jgi:hypothetical protein
MGRLCLCCASKQRALIEKDILANKESASMIARRYSVTKGSVLSHRRNHLAEAVESTLSQGAIELQAMLARADKLIKLLSRHLEEKPRTAVSLDWIRESRDLRGWLTYRSKHIGKVAPTNGAEKQRGDSYNVVFRGPDDKPLRIPLAVYEALPAEVFASGALDTQPDGPGLTLSGPSVTG